MLQLKTVKIILLSTFITGLTAIHGAYAAEKFKVITTFTVIADMAQKRGRGRRRSQFDYPAWRRNP